MSTTSNYGILGKIVYAAYPIVSYISTIGYTSRPTPYVWQPPKWVFDSLWIITSITTAIAGLYVYDLNYESATTFYFGLCWMLGSGWIFTVRYSKSLGHWAYLLWTLITSAFTLLLYFNVNENDSNNGKTDSANAIKAFLYPSIGWLAALLLLYTYSVLGVFIPKFRIDIDETLLPTPDPIVCEQCKIVEVARTDYNDKLIANYPKQTHLEELQKRKNV